MVVEYDYKDPFRQCRISKADIVTNFYQNYNRQLILCVIHL